MIRKDGRFGLKFRQVLWITLIWMVIGILDSLNTHAMAHSAYLERTASYHFGYFFTLNTLSATVAGLVSGGLLVFYLREWLRGRSFGVSLLINELVIVSLNIVITAFAFDLLQSRELGRGVFDPLVLQQTGNMLYSTYFLRNLFFWAAVVLLTLIMLNVNEKYGPGVFAKLLMGRYHRPREEERIFMFVDLRSSTTIAERLGHIRFFDLLNDFYRDITNPVIYTSGEIYQYVGDEIVISWTMKTGLADANCIRCFFSMRETIQKLSKRYEEKYGLIPEFKAGLHCGPVTIGEIGVIKKDIVFSGDVMNTTSRIQSVCNKFRVNILVSKYLLDLLHLPPHSYTPKRMGIIELKGKRQKVELYTFEESVDLRTPSPLPEMNQY